MAAVHARLGICWTAAGVLVAAASCHSSSGTAGGPNNAHPVQLPAGADASARAGAAVYARQCQGCHGPGGKGDGPSARKMNMDMPDLTAPEIAADSDQDYFNVVTKGSKPMPAFRDRLSERQRWDVVRFVRAAFAGGGKS